MAEQRLQPLFDQFATEAPKTFPKGVRPLVRSLVEIQRAGLALSVGLNTVVARWSIVAVGIGASTTVYSVVNTLLLRPLPLSAPGQLVWIANGESENLSAQTVQVANYLDLRDQNTSLSGVAAFSPFYGVGDVRLTGAGAPERVTAVPVTENFFGLLGVPPWVGRGFEPGDAIASAPVVVLAHGFWRRRFAADPSVVGRKIVLNDVPTSVIGVLPDSVDFAALFTPGSQADLFVPYPLTPVTNRRGNTLALIGRLAPNADISRAQAEASLITERIQRLQASGVSRNGFHPRISPLHDRVRGRFRTALTTLAGAVGLLMPLVCANLSNLLLARASARDRDLAVRRALGATQFQIVRQMLIESAVIAFSGAAAGLAFAWALTAGLSRFGGGRLPLEAVGLDSSALYFTCVTAIGTAIGLGVLPAWRAAATSPVAAWRGGGRGLAGPGRDRTRRVIVVAEIALACVLLTGAGLLTRSFVRLLDVDLGFTAEHVITLRVDPSRALTSVPARNAYFDAVLRETQAVAGVEAVGLTDALPLGENFGWRMWTLVSDVNPAADPAETALVRMIDDGYFRAMRIAVRSGRAFTAADTAGSEPVVIVNDALARRMWPGQDPVGRRLRTSNVDRRVIGVVGAVTYFALERDSGPEMYMPLRQPGDYAVVDLVVRGAAPELAVRAGVSAALARVDPGLPVAEFRTMDALVERSLFTRKFVLALITGFAALGLLLAAFGSYAVISYTVTQRVQEIGVRLALGATPRDVRRHFIRQTMTLALVGLAIGLLLAWAAGRAMQGLLFGVEAADPITLVAVFGALVVLAAAAGYGPARRASNIDPLHALRAE
jgi:predicted permease